MTSTNTAAKKGRPAIEGQRIEIKMEAELLDQLNAYAAEHGLRRPDALRALLRAGLAADADTPARKTMWDLFPEATNDQDLQELIWSAEECDIDTESAEYEPKGRPSGQISYDRLRGHWVLHRQEMTDQRDANGRIKFTNTYTVCKDKREAKRLFREFIVEMSQHWSPEHNGPMWVDFPSAWDTFTGLAKAGKIPAACYDHEDELYDGTWA